MTPRALLELRWQRVWEGLREEGLDGLYVAGKGHILGYGPFTFLSGHPLVLRYGAALIRPGSEPVLFTPTAAEELLLRARTTIRDVRHVTRPARAALETLRAAQGARFRLGVHDADGYLTVADARDLQVCARPGETVVDATGLLQRAKAVKLPADAAAMEATGTIVDAGFQTLLQHIRPGVSGCALAGEVERTIRGLGALDSLIFIGAGPHFLHFPDRAPLRRGQLVTAYVELIGPDGHWVERGGIISLGPPSATQQRIADACFEAHAAATAVLRPGAPSAMVCAAVETVAARHGYGCGIWHGHGVGIDHDIPSFAPGDRTVLAEDMFVALHPNFTDPVSGHAASVADCFRITAAGARRLSHFATELHRVD